MRIYRNNLFYLSRLILLYLPKSLYILLLFGGVFSLTFAQQTKKKLTVHDLLTAGSVSEPQFSPDGKWIAYTLAKREKWDGNKNSDIWLTAVDKSKTIQLTTAKENDVTPEWSSDGSKIAFISHRSDPPQVYFINLSGGEPKQITNSKNTITSFKWMESSSQIAYIADETRDSVIIKTEENAGGGYAAGTEFHGSALWAKTLEDTTPVKITDGSYFIKEMTPSPDGKYFALITALNSDEFNSYNRTFLLIINNAGQSIYSFNDAKAFSHPEFSPDNQKVAWIGCTVGYSSNNALFVYDLKSKTIKNLTEKFDPTIEEIKWLNNESLIFSTPRNVHTGIYKANLNGEITTLLEPYWAITSFNIPTSSEKIAFIGSKAQLPSELYLVATGGKPDAAVSLTNINQWVKNNFLIANSKVIKYTSIEGAIIEAVLTLPVGYNEKKKYPFIVLPHGGPDGIIMDRFSVFGQIFAAEDFIVFEPNFRGSIGYGSNFYAANRGRLGDIDYQDIMLGVDFLIKEGLVDSSKMVVGGWSYGGYMTNWILGHTTRFKAAVSVAGISNTVSMYAQSDINHGEVAEWEFKGVPVLNMENFNRASPINYLKNCTTPTLILHGEADARVPVAQAWELYRALKDINTEVEMVLYPDAGHSIAAPKQFADVMTRWVNWYKAHLGLVKKSQ